MMSSRHLWVTVLLGALAFESTSSAPLQAQSQTLQRSVVERVLEGRGRNAAVQYLSRASLPNARRAAVADSLVSAAIGQFDRTGDFTAAQHVASIIVEVTVEAPNVGFQGGLRRIWALYQGIQDPAFRSATLVAMASLERPWPAMRPFLRDAIQSPGNEAMTALQVIIERAPTEAGLTALRDVYSEGLAQNPWVVQALQRLAQQNGWEGG